LFGSIGSRKRSIGARPNGWLGKEPSATRIKAWPPVFEWHAVGV
jgi:hypothetical protein